MKTLTIILISCVFITTAKAEDNVIHLSEHIGASYAITMLGYGMYRSAFGMPKTTAFIFASLLSGLVGLSYKYMEPHGLEGDQFRRSMYGNGIGIGAAGITILAW